MPAEGEPHHNPPSPPSPLPAHSNTMIGKLRFSPGSLVLVKYSSYPVWPATVQRNATPGYTRYADIFPNRVGEEVIAYWVAFSGDVEGGWVSADHTVPYHPDLVSIVQASAQGSGWRHDLDKALHIAKLQYEELLSGTNARPTLAEADTQRVRRLASLSSYEAENNNIFPTSLGDCDHDRSNHQHHDSSALPKSDLIDTSRHGAPAVKGEPDLMDALTYHPPKSTRRANKQQKPRNKKRSSRSRRDLLARQELADLRECLRRRDAQIAKLTSERRQMRLTCSSRVRECVRQKEDEVARLRQEMRHLRKSREIAPASRIPTLEQWHLTSNPASFKEVAARLQNKYAAFCSGVRRYAKALEDLTEAKSSLSDVYQDLREHAQMAEVDIVRAEKAHFALGEILKDLRFSSSSEDAVIICD